MGKFDSPITNKNFSNQPLRDIEVPDESGYQPIPLDDAAMRDFQAKMASPSSQVKLSLEEENALKEARRAKRAGVERLSDGAKRRIEMLVGMTRLTRTVDLDGNSYVLQSLKSRELREAIVAAAEFDGTVEFNFEIRKQMLARSLTVIAGVDIASFLNSNILQDRLDFVEDMDHSLALRLYNEYIALAKEAEDKYSIKDDAQAQEVMNDLKK